MMVSMVITIALYLCISIDAFSPFFSVEIRPSYFWTVLDESSFHKSFISSLSSRGMGTLHAKNRRHDEDSSLARNKARTCIKQFLTQRSVQSFMHVLSEVRDPHTVQWMEDFGDSKNLHLFHGIGALNQTRFYAWDSFLIELANENQKEIIISTLKKSCWSKNNPYVEPEYVEIQVEIDPPSLSSRILSVREQLAREWMVDLKIISSTSDQILESYFSNTMQQRINEDRDEKDECPVDFDPDFGDASSFLPEQRGVFDRIAMSTLTNTIAFGGVVSPLRRRNLDLLILLSTQESIHRLMDQMMQDSSMDGTYNWFRTYYSTQVHRYFDGNQKIGRADDFIEGLMLTPPCVKSEGGKVTTVDPIRLVEKILDIRKAVVEEWVDIVSNVSKEHIDMRRHLFEMQMKKCSTPGKVRNSSENDISNLEENIEGHFQ